MCWGWGERCSYLLLTYLRLGLPVSSLRLETHFTHQNEPSLPSPNRLEILFSIQGTGHYLLCPTWEILSPSSDLIRALYCPHRAGTSGVSLHPLHHHPLPPGLRRRRFTGRLPVLLLSVEGATPILPRGKLRPKAARLHDQVELQMLAFPFCPLLCACPLPSAPWVTPLAPGVGEFRPQASSPLCLPFIGTGRRLGVKSGAGLGAQGAEGGRGGDLTCLRPPLEGNEQDGILVSAERNRAWV